VVGSQANAPRGEEQAAQAAGGPAIGCSLRLAARLSMTELTPATAITGLGSADHRGWYHGQGGSRRRARNENGDGAGTRHHRLQAEKHKGSGRPRGGTKKNN